LFHIIVKSSTIVLRKGLRAATIQSRLNPEVLTDKMHEEERGQKNCFLLLKRQEK